LTSQKKIDITSHFLLTKIGLKMVFVVVNVVVGNVAVVAVALDTSVTVFTTTTAAKLT
jgi:hypothetical protein